MIFRTIGSNMPRAMRYTMPSVLLSVAAHYGMEEYGEEIAFYAEKVNAGALWSATVIVLSVLISMRTAKAYDRFWEGITLVQLMRAEWFETASNLIAFSLVAIKGNPENQKVKKEVNTFQFTLVRLMSLMHGKALRSIGGHEEEFEVLDIQALDHNSLQYLSSRETDSVDPVDPVEVVLHWIQVLVTDAHSASSLPVPPPILTRVYQTLSRGMVNCHNARKLADCPFPFPLSQMVFFLLISQSVVTPIVLALVMRNPIFAAVTTFLPLFGMWSVTFTASELEQPFGNDPNDLPLCAIQRAYNNSLLMLLDKENYNAPSLKDEHHLNVRTLRRKHTWNMKNNASMTHSLPPPEVRRHSSDSNRNSLQSARESEDSHHEIKPIRLGAPSSSTPESGDKPDGFEVGRSNACLIHQDSMSSVSMSSVSSESLKQPHDRQAQSAQLRQISEEPSSSVWSPEQDAPWIEEIVARVAGIATGNAVGSDRSSIDGDDTVAQTTAEDGPRTTLVDDRETCDAPGVRESKDIRGIAEANGNGRFIFSLGEVSAGEFCGFSDRPVEFIQESQARQDVRGARDPSSSLSREHIAESTKQKDRTVVPNGVQTAQKAEHKLLLVEGLKCSKDFTNEDLNKANLATVKPAQETTASNASKPPSFRDMVKSAGPKTK
jgi:putative membrane protein